MILIETIATTVNLPNLGGHFRRCTPDPVWAADRRQCRTSDGRVWPATFCLDLFGLHEFRAVFPRPLNGARSVLGWRPLVAYSHRRPSTEMIPSGEGETIATAIQLQIAHVVLTLLHFVPNTICRLLSHCEQNTLLMTPNEIGVSLYISCIRICRLAYVFDMFRCSSKLNSRLRTKSTKLYDVLRISFCCCGVSSSLSESSYVTKSSGLSGFRRLSWLKWMRIQFSSIPIIG